MSAVLVIRLSALGDFVLSGPAFAGIRAHHPDAQITLLTTAPYADLARRLPWFDRVEIDRRPALWNLPALARLRRFLRGFDRVYDLQTSSRSTWYGRLAGSGEWSGKGSFMRFPDTDPRRDLLHTRERLEGQLRQAGIAPLPVPDWSALATGVPDLPPRAALLVPGAAPHRPGKRWPAEFFGELAAMLAARGMAPVVLGAAAEAPLAAAIIARCPTALDLTGRTALPDLFGLAARAALAVGNDTGPMHIAAAMGCPSVVLFGPESDPGLTAPRLPDGGWPQVIRAESLADLSVERVAAALPQISWSG
jgi:ADP-heptose:LPS heptosyltransferase